MAQFYFKTKLVFCSCGRNMLTDDI
uniref:Uncharacterized protein n=1 Tax=Anguilla anguilla TaxID=7936 RepID=A0A0E9U4F1_ANGAN